MEIGTTCVEKKIGITYAIEAKTTKSNIEKNLIHYSRMKKHKT